MKKDMRVYLDDILESIRYIEDYTKGMDRADFFKNHATQDAVMRRLGIIGEATKKISNEFKSAYPSIPWREMAGMRDVLIHEYSGVDLGRVWRTVKKDIPLLKERLRELMKKEDTKLIGR